MKAGDTFAFGNRIVRRFAGRARRLIDGYLTPDLTFSSAMSDREFLGQFTLPDLKHALVEDDIAGARDLLLAHYQQRISREWPRPTGRLTDLRVDLDTISDTDLINAAREVLSFNLSPSGVKPEVFEDNRIAWTRNVAGSREWLWMINRHAWWVILGLAYQRTGDECYATAFVDQLTDWITSNPPHDRKDESSPTWRLMETALRIRISWIPCFGLFYGSPEFGSDAKMMMLRSIHDHAIYLHKYKTSMNHLLRESNGLICTALCFPEFENSNHWLNAGAARVVGELPVQIYPDGTQVEISTGYQWLVVDELETTRSLLERSHLDGEYAATSDTLSRMYDLLMHLSRPDGGYPQLNDGFILWGVDRLMDAGERFGREDYVFVGSGGRRGKEPSRLSRPFPDSGLFIMRSAWSRDAHHLVFDAGPYGGHHGHEDKLSFDMVANGAPFIVDSGSYTYEVNDPYRNYFVSSSSHNTVLVDGLSQVRRMHKRRARATTESRADATWITGPSFDYCEGEYSEGYGHFDILDMSPSQSVTDVVHRRGILFVNREYWIILDRIGSHAPHRYTWLYHCDPAVNASVVDERRFRLRHGDSASGIDMIVSSAATRDVRVIKGQTDPIQGWFSRDHHKKEPADVLILEREAERGDVLATVFLPFNEKPREQTSISLEEPETGSGYRFVVVTEGFTDEITIELAPSADGDRSGETPTAIACRRTAAGGEPISLFSWRS